ncbi:MAG: DNA polymerase III subunit delta, partial [Gammaproteobacteria bacterium]|nr:DNA polymerase III subunit delta [Gammaproteobacteria bacterium]
MKLKPDQLSRHLDEPLKSVYLVSGDEPLLMQECCDLIRNK